ncbi:helix-turn-helix domain-containing protein [Chryseobacterium geocarposphaerae]|uniref:hypothetical protein n=1 Tax=Chryseobacterium geocarposphaerae TaxID=1416776 RepID=UPI0012FDB658|nr:hypothetical protein [Chryseobacterium geocarposphaerae]
MNQIINIKSISEISRFVQQGAVKHPSVNFSNNIGFVLCFSVQINDQRNKYDA